MSSTAASSCGPSRSTSAIAAFSVPTGPTTLTLWLSRKCARSLASVYSSSTTRIDLPVSVAGNGLSGIAVLLQDHAHRAAHAVRLEREAGLGAELVGQGALDQLAAVAVATLPVGGRHGDAAFLPLHHRAALGGVGRQLVQRQPERLRRAGRQRNRRPVEPHLARVEMLAVMGLQL